MLDNFESGKAINKENNKRSSYFIQSSLPSVDKKADFNKAQQFFQTQRFRQNLPISSLFFFQEWEKTSKFLLSFRILTEIIIASLIAGSVFALIPIVYNYLSHNLGSIFGYRFVTAVTSLAAPLDINLWRQLLVITLPDIAYTSLIALLLLIAKYRFKKQGSQSEQGVCRNRKVTPAVRLVGFQMDDQKLLASLTNYRQITLQYQFGGHFTNIYNKLKKIQSQRRRGTDQSIDRMDQEPDKSALIEAAPTGSALVVFTKQADRSNFIKIMKLNGRTNSLMDRLFGHCKEDKQLFGGSNLRLGDEYVDQPEDLFYEDYDVRQPSKVIWTVVFVLALLLVLFINFAVVSLPLALSVHNPSACNYPNPLTVNTLSQNASATQKYCFCANNQHQFFTANYNVTFYKACNSSMGSVLMSQATFVYSSLANIFCNAVTSYLVPVLVTGLLYFSSFYQKESTIFYTSLFAQLWNLVLVPVLINARFYNFRPINTINFFLSSVQPTATTYNDFTRMWFANLSIWFVTNMLLLLAVPWAKLLLSFLYYKIRICNLRAREDELSQGEMNQQICKRFQVGTNLADLLAPFLFTLVFCSGMPLLLVLCLINSFLNFLALQVRVFKLECRGYLPPSMFYAGVARTVLCILMLHTLIGCYMYGGILDCSIIFSKPSGVFDRVNKIVGPIHVLIFLGVLAGAVLMVDFITENLVLENQNFSLAEERSRKSYALEKNSKYESVAKYFYLPTIVDHRGSSKVVDKGDQHQVIPVVGINSSTAIRSKNRRKEERQ